MTDQKKYNEILKRQHTEAVAQSLAKATIGIAGLGGLGSNAAVALARAGVGNLILCDFDRVEDSNITRQAFRLEHLGQKKTEVMQKIITEINPYVSLTLIDQKLTESNCETIFRGCPIVIEAVDIPETKQFLLERLSSDKRWIIAASGLAGYGKNNSIREIKTGRIIFCGDQISEVEEGIPLMSTRVGIVAYMQANAAIECIIDGENHDNGK